MRQMVSSLVASVVQFTYAPFYLAAVPRLRIRAVRLSGGVTQLLMGGNRQASWYFVSRQPSSSDCIRPHMECIASLLHSLAKLDRTWNSRRHSSHVRTIQRYMHRHSIPGCPLEWRKHRTLGQRMGIIQPCVVHTTFHNAQLSNGRRSDCRSWSQERTLIASLVPCRSVDARPATRSRAQVRERLPT